MTNGSGGDGAGRGRVAVGYWVQPDDRDPEAVQVLLDGTRSPSPVGLPPFAYSSVQDDLGLRVPSEVPDEVLVESGLGARDDEQVADQARLGPLSAAPQIASSSRAPPAAAMTGPSSETGDGIGVAIVRVRW